MSQAMVRIAPATHAVLKDLAAREQDTLQAVLDRAVEEYRRRRFLEGINDGYATLRADAGAWAKEQAERTLLEGTLSDGLPEAGVPAKAADGDAASAPCGRKKKKGRK
jgi:hypothetical protein